MDEGEIAEVFTHIPWGNFLLLGTNGKRKCVCCGRREDEIPTKDIKISEQIVY